MQATGDIESLGFTKAALEETQLGVAGWHQVFSARPCRVATGILLVLYIGSVSQTVEPG